MCDSLKSCSCPTVWPEFIRCVFAASAVDAVGEVVMNVDILPQPNGEHKIGIKGKIKQTKKKGYNHMPCLKTHF